MNSRFLSAAGTFASIAALSHSHAAFAQQPAQQEVSGAPALEEIVVSARRRDEKIQTVPAAITAFTQRDLETKHIEEIHDLIRDVPSLAMSDNQSDPNAPFSAQLNLRGLQGVVTYFAGVPIGAADEVAATGLSHGLSVGNFFDLDHVEIDKGPQGTLFGRNSIAA